VKQVQSRSFTNGEGEAADVSCALIVLPRQRRAVEDFLNGGN